MTKKTKITSINKIFPDKQNRINKIMLTVTDNELARIDEMALKLRMTRSTFLNQLVNMALDDNEFLIDFLSVTAVPAIDLLNKIKTAARGSGPQGNLSPA